MCSWSVCVVFQALFSVIKRFRWVKLSWLLLILLLSGVSSVNAQLTYQNLAVDYDSAIEYRHLKIIPIREKSKGNPTPPMMSLSKALKEGKVVISERGTASTENVHWLRINNKSNVPLFIASGEVVLGGRQDRMVTRDTILVPTGSDQYVSVMCVEEDRWSDKEKKFAYFSFANPRLRKVVDHSRNQVLIWKEIFDQLDSNKIKSPTLAYAGQRTDKKWMALHDEYMNAFLARLKSKDSTWVGFVCVSGDRVLGTDVFASSNLFYDQLESLLHGYVEDALNTGGPVSIPDEKVRKYMDQLLTDEKSQAEYVKKNGKIFRHQGKVIHLTGFGE